MKKLIAIVLFALVLGGCHRLEVIQFEDDYPSMKGQEHVYIKTDYTTALNIILNDTGVVLFAFDTKKYACPYCQEVVPLLNEVALEEGWEAIYYFDIYEMRINNTTEYRLLMGYLDSQTNSLLEKDGVKTLIVPDVYFVKEGKIVAHHIATLYNEDNRFVLGMDSVQIHTLKDLYRSYFQALK
ncbi:MAG: hypothetical protein WCQ80_01980 [Bacilli bacterium]